MCRAALALATMAAVAGSLQGAAPDRDRPLEPPYFAIQGARVVSGAGPALESATVVIAHGLIQAVGTDVAIPPEARLIDGAGLTVYPGLVSAVSDLGLQAGEGGGGGGGGSAAGGGPPGGGRREISRGPEDRPGATPWVAAADQVSLEDSRLESWRKGGFTWAVVAPGDGIFPGQAAAIQLAAERDRELVLATPVALNVRLDPPSGFRSFPSSLMGVLAYVHQMFLDAQHAELAWARYDKSPRGRERPTYDRTLEPLRRAAAERWPVLLAGQTAGEIRRAVELGEAIGMPVVLVGAQQGYEVAAELAAKKVPAIVDLEWPKKPSDADPDADTPLRVLRFRARAPTTPAALAAAGVRFAFSPGKLATPKEVLDAARKAIDEGLSEDAALAALTRSPAEIFGLADRLGTIERGKIADLTVTDGPLFGEKTKVKMVFIDGALYEVREPGRPEEPPEVNLSGRWELTVQTRQGTRESTAELTMDDDGNLTGSVRSERGEGSITSGWVSGKKFSFTLSMSRGGRTFEATYTGSVEGDEMKGNASFGRFSAEFTGKRPGESGATGRGAGR